MVRVQPNHYHFEFVDSGFVSAGVIRGRKPELARHEKKTLPSQASALPSCRACQGICIMHEGGLLSSSIFSPLTSSNPKSMAASSRNGVEGHPQYPLGWEKLEGAPIYLDYNATTPVCKWGVHFHYGLFASKSCWEIRCAVALVKAIQLDFTFITMQWQRSAKWRHCTQFFSTFFSTFVLADAARIICCKIVHLAGRHGKLLSSSCWKR